MIDKENNFDFLRLLFASLVIVSHSFPLTNTKNEPLLLISNGQIDFGALAVKSFFTISGYLIYIKINTNLLNSKKLKFLDGISSPIYKILTTIGLKNKKYMFR